MVHVRCLAAPCVLVLALQPTVIYAETAKPAGLPSQPAESVRPDEGGLILVGLDVRGARVLVDGRLEAIGPVTEPLFLPPGRHRLEVEAVRFRPWHKEIELPAGRMTSIVVSLTYKSDRGVGWLAAALSGSILAVGAEVAAIAFHIQANRSVRQSEEFEAARSRAITSHILAGSLLIGALIPFTIYLFKGRIAPDDQRGIIPPL